MNEDDEDSPDIGWGGAGQDLRVPHCRVYWGSHGCDHPRGHDPEIPHECDCCECEHHPYPDWPETNVICVARPPYYGPETLFYGEEAEALGLPVHKR